MNILQRISKSILERESKRHYFAVAEQILSSATTMLASIVVAKFAGLEWLGVFSFMLVFVALANSIVFTLIIRQMTLEISTLNVQERQNILLTTIIMVLVLFAVFLPILCLPLFFLPSEHWIFDYPAEITACVLFVVVGSVFEVCKQYFYVTNNHHKSFKYTLISSTTSLSMIVVTILLSKESDIVARVLLSFSTGFCTSFLFNAPIHQALIKATWNGWSYVKNTFKTYYQQSRYGLIGLLVTWGQNQSIIPFLMFLYGPLVVGYFSMARLLVMPVSVINQGLLKGITPNLRRTFKSLGFAKLAQSISKFELNNLFITLTYFGTLLAGHLSGLLHRFVPDYQSVELFLGIWVLTLLITTHRFWLGQFFIVSMQFKFLMNVALIALCVSICAMIGLGYGTGNPHFAFLAVVLGELVVLYFCKKKRNEQLRQEAQQ